MSAKTEFPLTREQMLLCRQRVGEITKHLSDLGVERLDDKMLVASKICSLLSEVDIEAFLPDIEKTEEGKVRVVKMASDCVAKVLQMFAVSLARFDFDRMKADVASATLKDAPRPPDAQGEPAAPAPAPEAKADDGNADGNETKGA